MTYIAATIDPFETSASDWANGIRDRTVNVFSSTADRDSQITSPTAGMVCHIGRQTWVYNGAAWVPLGCLVLDTSVRTADMTATGTEVTTGDKVSFSAVADHRYRIHYSAVWQISEAVNNVEFNLRYAAGASVTTSSTRLRARTLVCPGANYLTETNWAVSLSGLSAGTYSVEMFVKRSVGAGTVSVRASSTEPVVMSVENLGAT